MKKVFLSLAVVACVAMVSCGGNKAKEEAAEEANAPEVEEVVADAAVVNESIAPDSTASETVVAVAAEPVQAQ